LKEEKRKKCFFCFFNVGLFIQLGSFSFLRIQFYYLIRREKQCFKGGFMSAVYDMLVGSHDHFLITRKSHVELKPGSPFPVLLKESTFAVVCGDSMFKRLCMTIHDLIGAIMLRENRKPWWTPTANPKIVVHSTKGKEYLLCALYKESNIMGSSFFIYEETGEMLTKKDIKEWLPDRSEPDTMALPIESIVKVIPLLANQPEPELASDGLKC
jgi:hypothetical protein